MSSTWRLRAALNWLNLSTPLGLVVARCAGVRVERAADGLWLGDGYEWRFPVAGAFTVGNVILSRPGLVVSAEPALRAHEARHCWQYALLGPYFLPLYFLAVAVSILTTGSPALNNPFERGAGLAAGGYIDGNSGSDRES